MLIGWMMIYGVRPEMDDLMGSIADCQMSITDVTMGSEVRVVKVDHDFLEIERVSMARR